MPQYVDCYFLMDSRDKNIVKNFVEHISNETEITCDDFLVANGKLIIEDVFILMKYLEQNENEVQYLYWRNKNEKSPYKYIMAFYTDDGKIIFGVSMEGNSPLDSTLERLSLRIKSYLKSSIGCMTVEEMPPANSSEFLEFCKQRYTLR
ncbi:hypothetical protein EV195_104183 [Tenacibaculum skagerrakense]|uniref:Uncharacterized protein n=1 Tax=Tenacibaculum skagerrakense TaxID=186571 RepID=A0A4R2NT95_9FLAO|nr:hypothetical protein [Tenacibaculum skagerrakense]TCP25150.1 hypothetical protein EV195_104183 [Tenacibaculum skagerrakense]